VPPSSTDVLVKKVFDLAEFPLAFETVCRESDSRPAGRIDESTVATPRRRRTVQPRQAFPRDDRAGSDDSRGDRVGRHGSRGLGPSRCRCCCCGTFCTGEGDRQRVWRRQMRRRLLLLRLSVPASGGRGVLIKPAVSSSIVPLSEPFPFMRPGDENGARAFEAGVARLVGVARGKWAEAEEAGGRVDAVGSGSSICRTVCIVSPVALHSSLCPQDVTTCSRDQKLNK
jgi:hypothetical protein